MYTVTQLALEAGCSRTYIKAEIRHNRLAARRVGNQYQITNKAARAWLANPRRGSRMKLNTQGE